MRKLSTWAKFHPWSARIIIVISHILLMSLAWYTGLQFNYYDILLPGYLLLVFILLYLASVFVYPSKKEKEFLSNRLYYSKQKACDFTLAFAAYGMMVCIADHKDSPYIFQPAYGITAVNIPDKKEKPTASQILESLKHRDKSTLTRKEKRILQQEFKLQLKNYAVATVTSNKAKKDQAGLIILAIIGALGLAYLVSALACSLACNGYDGFAIIVLILGGAGIVLGLIFAIKAINKKSKKQKEESDQKRS